MRPNDDDLVTVYTTNSPIDAEMVKNLLRTEGIHAEAANEMQAGLAGVLQIPVLVRPDDVDRARKLLASHSHLQQPHERED
ncbi:MAG: DUF2007 domain-containing protein [Gemmataceae bacterium]